MPIEHMFDRLDGLMDGGTTALATSRSWDRSDGLDDDHGSNDDHGDLLALRPGKITEVTGSTGMGMTRLGLGLLAPPSLRSPVAALDVRGWLSPLAAWEMGVNPAHFVVVRCPEQGIWPQVAAALMEGVKAMYAEVPAGVRPQELRRLAALARARRAGVVLRPLGERLPPGVAHLRLHAVRVRWEGAERGHGRLRRRYLVMEASGKGMAGMAQRIEMVDDGTDAMRVVSRVGADHGEPERAVG